MEIPLPVTQCRKKNLALAALTQKSKHPRLGTLLYVIHCYCVCLPVLWKTPGLQWQYLWAKASIILSIFWASPGKRKLHRNCLRKTGWGLGQRQPILQSRQSCTATAPLLHLFFPSVTQSNIDSQTFHCWEHVFAREYRTLLKTFLSKVKIKKGQTDRVYLRAWTRFRSVNSWRSTKAWSTLMLKSSLQNSSRESRVKMADTEGENS